MRSHKSQGGYRRKKRVSTADRKYKLTRYQKDDKRLEKRIMEDEDDVEEGPDLPDARRPGSDRSSGYSRPSVHWHDEHTRLAVTGELADEPCADPNCWRNDGR